MYIEPIGSLVMRKGDLRIWMYAKPSRFRLWLLRVLLGLEWQDYRK